MDPFPAFSPQNPKKDSFQKIGLCYFLSEWHLNFVQKFQTNRQADKRANLRRVYHWVFTSWVQKNRWIVTEKSLKGKQRYLSGTNLNLCQTRYEYRNILVGMISASLYSDKWFRRKEDGAEKKVLWCHYSRKFAESAIKINNEIRKRFSSQHLSLENGEIMMDFALFW